VAGDFGEQIVIGRVIARGWASLTHHWLAFLSPAFLIVGAPTLLIETLLGVPAGGNWIRSVGAASALLLLAVYTILDSFLRGTLVRSSILDMSGRPADIGGSLGEALSILPALVGLSIATTIAMAIGFVLLVIPGFMVIAALSVAIPVLVQERPGVINSMMRSAELTSGSRWPIFGLLILYGLVTWALQVVAIAVGAAFGGAAASFVKALTSSATVALLSAMTASLYVELRAAKEGDGAEALADIFA
jgi:hypothetical protein